MRPNKRPNKQLPDYRASPDFVGPIGLFEIWRSAIIIMITSVGLFPPLPNRQSKFFNYKILHLIMNYFENGFEEPGNWVLRIRVNATLATK